MGLFTGTQFQVFADASCRVRCGAPHVTSLIKHNKVNLYRRTLLFVNKQKESGEDNVFFICHTSLMNHRHHSLYKLLKQRDYQQSYKLLKYRDS